MTNEKLFFQYKEIMAFDENHTIENLSKNQFYFKDPTKFNDPFDCKVYLDRKGTEENWINWLLNRKNAKYTKAEAKEILNDKEYFEKKGDFFFLDPNGKLHAELKIYLHGDLNKETLPRVCCFSGTDESILMWSHYANDHHGICLRFRLFIDPNNIYSLDYFLYLQKTKQSILIESPFFKVN